VNASALSTGVRDMFETDVDCGGNLTPPGGIGCATKCGSGQSCFITERDCQTGLVCIGSVRSTLGTWTRRGVCTPARRLRAA
jgi:hypothetical protein